MEAAMTPSVCWTYREATHRRHAQSSRRVSNTNVILTLSCLLVLLGPLTPEALLYVLLCRTSGGGAVQHCKVIRPRGIPPASLHLERYVTSYRCFNFRRVRHVRLLRQEACRLEAVRSAVRQYASRTVTAAARSLGRYVSSHRPAPYAASSVYSAARSASAPGARPSDGSLYVRTALTLRAFTVWSASDGSRSVLPSGVHAGMFFL